MCQRSINCRLLATGHCHSGLVHKQREAFLQELLLQSTATVSRRVYQRVQVVLIDFEKISESHDRASIDRKD